MQAREGTARPQTRDQEQQLYPVDVSLEGRGKELEEQDVDDTVEVQIVDTDARPVWENIEDLANTYEILETKVAEYVDDQEVSKLEGFPVVKIPSTPTREEHQRHQVTHTPYAPWCRH